MGLNTPVVLLIFDRAELTSRVFQQIARQRPQTLLIVGDGAHADDPESAVRVAQTRRVVEQVDWLCDVRTNYFERNVGCQRRVSSGLDWAFGQFEQAIVLEDDCLPDPTFFAYCEQLLERYADDEQIWAISGDNFQFDTSRTESSYYFSRYPHCWGWASWSRAWEKMDLELKQWPAFQANNGLTDLFATAEEIAFWTAIFEAQHQGLNDSWAFPWTFSSFLNRGLTVLPDVNLVSNIGFGDGASHTQDDGHRLANLPVASLDSLHHPKTIACHKEADQFTFDQVFSPSIAATEKVHPTGQFKSIWNRIRKRSKSMP